MTYAIPGERRSLSEEGGLRRAQTEHLVPRAASKNPHPPLPRPSGCYHRHPPSCPDPTGQLMGRQVPRTRNSWSGRELLGMPHHSGCQSACPGCHNMTLSMGMSVRISPPPPGTESNSCGERQEAKAAGSALTCCVASGSCDASLSTCETGAMGQTKAVKAGGTERTPRGEAQPQASLVRTPLGEGNPCRTNIPLGIV